MNGFVTRLKNKTKIDNYPYSTQIALQILKIVVFLLH